MNQCCQKTWWVKINIYIYKNILKSILQKICPPPKKAQLHPFPHQCYWLHLRSLPDSNLIH